MSTLVAKWHLIASSLLTIALGVQQMPLVDYNSIKLNTKIRIYQAVLITTLLHGAEVWSTIVQEQKRFSGFHNRWLRTILGINWDDRDRYEIYRRTIQPPLPSPPLKSLL